MANRIKGITVEIGGDTTKLTESLKSVDKQISQYAEKPAGRQQAPEARSRQHGTPLPEAERTPD
jgi:hypothetical protein